VTAADLETAAADVVRVGGQVTGQLDHLGALIVTVPGGTVAQEVKRLESVDDAFVDTTFFFPDDAAARNLIGQPLIQMAGADGAGQVVAVLDTGIDTRLFGCGDAEFTAPGCKLTGQWEVAVPGVSLPGYRYDNGADGQADDDDEHHGSKVAGSVLLSAPNAKIAFIDVFGRYTCTTGPCDHGDTLLVSSDALIATGIDKALELAAAGQNITVVNLSLGTRTLYAPGTCPAHLDSVFAAADAAGMLTVVAAGNNGSTGAVSFPACAPGAIAVGAVHDTDGASSSCQGNTTPVRTGKVTCYTNASDDLDLFAPGSYISTIGGYTSEGTSYAAPITAGAAASLRQAAPHAELHEVRAALLTASTRVTDTRATLNATVKPLLDMDAALAQLQGRPLPPGPERRFSAIDPKRIVDTRGSPFGPIGTTRQAVGASERSFDVSEAVGVPASDIGAVALNITAIDPSGPCYLRVWPTGGEQPFVSNLNVAGGQTRSNSVIVEVGTDGRVSMAAGCEGIDAAIDLVGWFPTGADLQTSAPVRIVDTRLRGADSQQTQILLHPLAMARPDLIAGDGASALVNITVTNATDSGYLTVWPSGTDRPWTSTLNFNPGETVANFTIATTGADGGLVLGLSGDARADLIVDFFGHAPAASSTYHGLVPARLLDTRAGSGTCTPGCHALVANSKLRLQVSELAGVPSTADAVVLNVTAIAAGSDTFITAWPSGPPRPDVSNVYAPSLAITPNQVIVKLGGCGCIDIYNASGSSHVVADVVGWM
ncbi:MAG: S8 family serine peptidase, partial [Acidimicrobiales bacterium]|nr:S8 family serine peptidase [Acidimicrobiales bacterium]